MSLQLKRPPWIKPRRQFIYPYKTKLFIFKFSVFFTETVNSAGGINKTLFTGIEWVAVGANFCVNCFTFGRKRFNFKTAGTLDFCFINFWMYAVFHALLLIIDKTSINRYPILCKRYSRNVRSERLQKIFRKHFHKLLCAFLRRHGFRI